MNTDVLIQVLSWEERYIKGLKGNLDVYNPSKIIIFCYNNPRTVEWKDQNLSETKAITDKDIEIISLELKPQANWVVYQGVFEKYCISKKVVVDISTMPREAIWLILFNCRKYNCLTSFVYYKPQKYPGWISRDPDEPRLLYKMSGIAKLGAPTLLVITAGYDIQRLDNLIFNFEPKQTMIFFQHTTDSRNKENFEECKMLCKEKYNIQMLFEYDAYNINSSLKAITSKLKEVDPLTGLNYIEGYNVILNSLGSKTSAITLFEIWLKYPEFALSYIPSKEYNEEYSKGVSKIISDDIVF